MPDRDKPSSKTEIRLDEAFLADVHLDGLSSEEGKLMLAHIYETLEHRVGLRLTAAMTPEELDEFELTIEEGDEQGAQRWLQRRFPEHPEMVREELGLLRSEIRQIAPAILSLGGVGRR